MPEIVIGFVIVSIFIFVTVVIVGIFIFVIGSMVVNYRRYASSPLIARKARVIGKRQCVSGGMNTSTSTHYYVTFELRDGSREELVIDGESYGLLVEGDMGTLHSKSNWFKRFDRESPL